MGDGVNSYGEWWNVGLHKLSANLSVAQATLAKRLSNGERAGAKPVLVGAGEKNGVPFP
jgi:hypothetical protein